MPAENEELDVIKNRKWRPFVNLLRGASCLDDEDVLLEFDRALVPSLRRVFKLLRVKDLVNACIRGDSAEIERLRREHRKQRDRAETFADHIVSVCQEGMTYRQAIDAFVHGACARTIDQAALSVVPSDNFPTMEDYRQASAIWLFRMEGRVRQLVDQIVEDPAKLQVLRQSQKEKEERFGKKLGWSLLDRKEEQNNGGDVSGENQES